MVEALGALAAGVVDEDVEVLEDGDQDAEAQGEVGAVQAKGRGVGQLRRIDALGSAGFHKVDVRDQDGDPGEDAEDGDEVDEVAEDFAGVVADVEEGDAGDEGRESERVDGHAAAIGPGEDGVGVSFLGQAVEGTGGDVEIAIGGGKDEDEDAGVDDSGQVLDLAFDDGDDKRGCRRPCLCVFSREDESGAVVGDQGSDEEDRQDVEDQDPPERQLDRSGDDFPRILGLADGDSDQFGSITVNRCLGRLECSITHPRYANVAITNVLHRPMKRPLSPAIDCVHTLETASDNTTRLVLTSVERFHGPGILPISKPFPVAIRTTPSIRIRESRIRPQIVTTLMELNQNSNSPKKRIPR